MSYPIYRTAGNGIKAVYYTGTYPKSHWAMKPSVMSDPKVIGITDESMRRRIWDFLNEKHDRHHEQRLCVATHGGVIRNLIAELEGKETDSIRVENAAIFRLSVESDPEGNRYYSIINA